MMKMLLRENTTLIMKNKAITILSKEEVMYLSNITAAMVTIVDGISHK